MKNREEGIFESTAKALKFRISNPFIGSFVITCNQWGQSH